LASASGAHDAVLGAEGLKGMVMVDQSPIGRTPRSNPVTYIKAYDEVRRIFAGPSRIRSGVVSRRATSPST
jgi:excinuclease ABC subunit A